MKKQYAKLQLLSTGISTYIELDGKTMGDGIVSVSYEHNAMRKVREGEPLLITDQKVMPTLKLEIDLDKFSFMPDGHFDKVKKEIFDEEKPPTKE